VALQTLIVVDTSEKRLAVAKTLGATHVINAAQGNVIEKITEIVGTSPMAFAPTTQVPNVDLIFDAVGYIKERQGQAVFEQASSLPRTRPHRRRRRLRGPRDGRSQSLFGKQLKVFGSLGMTYPPSSRRPWRFSVRRRWTGRSLFPTSFPSRRGKEAFETQAKSGESVKVIFKA